MQLHVLTTLYTCLVIVTCVLLSGSRCHAQLSVQASFNQRGVRGTIIFTQDSPGTPTAIAVNITGLESSGGPYPWHVHQYPFPLDAQLNPCRDEIVGGHYDPLQASNSPDYAENCAANSSLCELGDLSGRLGNLNGSVVTFSDPFLSLHGIYSIVGRSVVIHFPDNSRFVCANIDYPQVSEDAVDILYSPFRNSFIGNIFFRQHTNNFTASVYTDLIMLPGADSAGHNWHVHESPLDAGGEDCSVAGPHYNPRNVDVSSSDYPLLCSPANQSNCEIGDLSNKGSPFDVVGGVTKQFYTDTDLPLSGGEIFIIDRSIVIHEENRGPSRIACANISRYAPLEAEAIFTSTPDTGVTGSITFLQTSPFDHTRVTVQLSGLDEIVDGYHIHEFPIGPATAGFPARCGSNYAGGHWNPHQVQYSTSDPPVTSDDYEVGDLSGKFDGLDGRDEISETYYDPNIPLFGPFGIIGRSIVLHMNNPEGSRLTCANIQLRQPVVTVTYMVNTSSIVGQVTLMQAADDPRASTTIVIELEVIQELEVVPPQMTSSVAPIVTSTSPILSATSTAAVVSTPMAATSTITSSPVFTSASTIASSPMVTSTPMVVTSTIISSPMVTSTPMAVTSTIISSPVVTSTPMAVTSTIASSPVVTSTPMAVTSTIASSPVVTSIPMAATSTIASSPVVSSTPMVAASTVAPSSIPMVATLSPSITQTVLPTSSSLNENVTSTMEEIQPTSSPSVPISSSTIAAPLTSSPLPVTPAVSTFMMPASSSLPPSPSANMGLSTSVMESSLSPMTSQILAPSPTPPSQRRRRSSPADEVPFERKRRQATPTSIPFNWSLRSGEVTSATSCQDLPVLGPLSSSEQCSMSTPLLCSVGDLTAKHGTLNLPQMGGTLRAVFTDPNLPLSGPNSAFSTDSQSPPPLSLQPVTPSTQDSTTICNPAPAVELPPPPPPTTPPPTTPPPTTPPPATPPTTNAPPGISTAPPSSTTAEVPPPERTSDSVGPIIGGVLAAVIAVVLIIVVILLVGCLVKKRRGSKYDISKASRIEMGTRTPAKPILNVPNYRALHVYKPQNDGDLALQPGDWVTLEETPYGGGWWRGSVEGKDSGWFPKTYVEYVDREAEKKKRQEESFTLAAAAIMDASSSFSSHHLSMASAESSKPKSKKSGAVKKSHTFSKREIDSTPKMVTKFDKPYLERDDVMVIENQMKDSGSLSGGSHPETPKSIRSNEIIKNPQATEEDDNDLEAIKAQLGEGEFPEDVLLHAMKHVAKYDFTGTTDIELEFKKGKVIKVLEKMDDGWWQGVCDGQIGWFPQAYVDPTPIGRGRGRAESSGSATGEVEKPRNMDETMAAGGDLEALEYRAVFSYTSDSEGDLVFSEGDTVLVYWGQENGWWFGSFGGRQGWFPESYVEPIMEESVLLEAQPETQPTATNEEELPVISEQEESSAGDQVPATTPAPPAPPAAEVTAVAEEKEQKTQEGTKPESDDTERLETMQKEGGLQGELAKALIKRSSFSHNKHLSVAASQEKEKPAEEKPPIAAPSDVPVMTEKVSTPTAGPGEKEEVKKTEAPKKVTKAQEDSEKKPAPLSNAKQQQTAPGRRRAAPPPPKAKTPSTLAVAASPNKPQPSPRASRSEQPSPVPSSPKTPTTPNQLQPSPVPAPKVPSSPNQLQPSPVPALKVPSSPNQLQPSPVPAPRTPTLMPVKEAAEKKQGERTVTKDEVPPPAAKLASPSKPAASNMKKRRTTAIDNRMRPRSRPPPPVPAELLEAAKKAEAEKAAAAKDGKTETPTSTPIPPPRAKARMKKVKRPTSRLIPPPPSIPLPPPPPKKTSPLVGRAADTDAASAAPESPLPPTTPTNSEPEVTRRVKTSRPPPPKRISSLALGPGGLKVEKDKEELPQLKERKEDSEKIAITAKKSPRLQPPRRPPPPKPTATIPTSQPPSQPRPSRLPSSSSGKTEGSEPLIQSEAEVSDGGKAIGPRGSKLMSSLKKMVRRDSKDKSSRGGDSEEKPAATRPQRPQPPKRASTTTVTTASVDASPVPKPRKKKKSSISGPSGKDDDDEELSHEPEKTPSSPVNNGVSLQQQEPPPRPGQPSSASSRTQEQSKGEPVEGNKEPEVPSKPPPPQPLAESLNTQKTTSSEEPKKSTSSSSSSSSQSSKSEPRKSSIIPSKPPPPVTATKPKPPLAPKPSNLDLSKPKSAPLKSGQSGNSTPPEPTGTKEQEPVSNGHQQHSPPPTNFYRATKDVVGVSDTDLSFSKGDTIMFIGKRDKGFLYGMLDDGSSGLFPVSAVEPFLKK